jgi:RNA polymerase sigma-B factor
MFRHLHALEAGSVGYRRQREVIIQRCLPLAHHIARRYGGRGEPHDDLVQAACVGLVKAVNRFDLENGADFMSFAVPTMIGEVRKHFRDYGWAVKVPRRMKDLQAQLNNARAELSQRLGRAPNASEVAEHLGVDSESVIEATIAGGSYSTLSTDMPAGPDVEFKAIGETLGDVDPGLDRVLDVETARPLIAALPNQQRTVLTLRFFENMSQSQIGERMGYSQMHISRLLAKALDALRSQVREPHLAVSDDLATQRLPGLKSSDSVYRCVVSAGRPPKSRLMRRFESVPG